MKSMKFTNLLLILSLIVSTKTLAQLNGNYTVGGTAPDYATVQAAATAVQSSGVSGPVVFNIRPGTYSESVDIGAVAGSSATNTITFKAENDDSTSVILTDSADGIGSNYTFHIFGTDYLILRNLTIQRPGTNVNATVISIGSNPKFLQIRNCIIQANTSTTTNDASSLINFPLGNVNDTSITISNNKLIGSAYGLYLKSQSPASQIALTQITNNEFIDQGYRAMQLNNLNLLNIHGNTITTHSTSTAYRAIFLTRATGAFTITENKILGINAGGNSIHLDTCSGTAGNRALIANNFVQTQGTGTVRTIFVSQCSYLNFYYNTINITTTGTNTFAFYINDSGSGNNLVVKNNIFVNTGGGLIYRVPSGALASLASSDYNDLYVPPSSAAIAFLDTGNLTTFADWQLASLRDSNSVSADPQFVSSTDLHVDNAAVNDAAVVVSGVTTDIDGEPRSNSTPDIGADEFTPLTDNIGILSIASPVSVGCGDSALVFGVVVHNYGLNTQTGFPVHADITGSVSQNLSEVYSDSLATNEEDTVYFSQTINTYAGGTIDVIAYTGLTADQYRANDTVSASFTFLSHPNAPSVQSPQQQCDNNVMVTATPDSGDVLFWYDQPVGGNLLFTGNPFNPVVSTDTTFYVESHSGSGSFGCLRITEIQPDGSPDYLEIQNISGTSFDATGWRVYASADNNDINNVNDSSWALGFFNAGEVQYKTDGASDNYWGKNLDWTGGFGSWVLIIDNLGNIVDFVVWDWDSATVQSMNITVNGFNLSPGSAWAGDGFSACSTPTNQRVGTDDHDDASDWSCDAASKGVANTNLATVFTNCGIGFCGSPRLPVDVTLIPGVTPVNLGNDTVISGPFSITLDADTGYTSYLWSTGETSQTIVVNTFGIYWVTVTGGPNGCTYTDSIEVISSVGLNNIISIDEFSFYPNPASDKLILKGHDDVFADATVRITDIQGREAHALNRMKISSGEYVLDITDLTNGIYFLQIVSGNRMRIEKFVVLR